MREVVYSLSESLDFVGIDDTRHGKRVAYMAAEVAKELGYTQAKVDDILAIGMLHDCGVSSTDVHSHLVNELDWDNSYVHSFRGAKLLENVTVFKAYAPYILHHHTHWDSLPVTLSDDEKNIANLIYTLDRVDALRAQLKDVDIRSTRSIIETLHKYSGTLFKEEFVETFTKLSKKESFWFYLEEESLDEYFMEWIAKGEEKEFSFQVVKEIALMFAAVVDAKSTYTSEHSLGVANLSRYLAELMQLSKKECELVELSGLLHDLGKLRVADAILNKPSKLNADERLKMNRHGFDSSIVLRHIKGFKEIAKIASLHHEKLDASGYPFSLGEKEIPVEARIVAVADIFQALIQNRPYRSSLSKEEAYEIIKGMGDEHKLDSEIIKLLHKHIESCYEAANVQYKDL